MIENPQNFAEDLERLMEEVLPVDDPRRNILVVAILLARAAQPVFDAHPADTAIPIIQASPHLYRVVREILDDIAAGHLSITKFENAARMALPTFPEEAPR